MPSPTSRAGEPPAAAPADEPAGGARLRGRVLASDGKTAVTGAVVRLHYLADGREIAADPTDRKGRFEIEGLPHGHADLTVEGTDGRFAGGDVLSIAPRGRLAVDLTLTRLEERSASWWASRGALQLPGGQGSAVGVADIRPELQGRDFWKSKKGIAVLTTLAGVALIAIAAGSRNSPSDRP